MAVFISIDYAADEREKSAMNVAQAKQLHLKDVLARLGYEAQREDKGEHWYLSPFREESDASFKITRDGRGWFDHGAGQGGNILDFVIRYFNLPENGVRQALQKLDGLWGGAASQMELDALLRTREAFSEPVNNGSYHLSSIAVKKIGPLRSRTLIRYLAGRGIPARLAQPYVQQMKYRLGNRHYVALAFASDGGGYELRNARFKGCYDNKDISTLQVKHSDAVSVFEGFMDFLSAAAYAGRTPRHHTIVLNSGSMRERALAAIRHLEVKRVYLWLDHDSSGREMTRYFKESLEGYAVEDASGLYAGYKDMNDYWIATQEKASTRSA
ncbi:MAG: toprim domain-containing protein [Caldilineaceae bacterium]